MKYTLRYPLEQYAFVEAEIDGTPEEAAEAYAGMRFAFSVGRGLSEKEMDAVLTEYLSTGSVLNGTELYATMSKEQQLWIQRIKRALKRIEAANQ